MIFEYREVIYSHLENGKIGVLTICDYVPDSDYVEKDSISLDDIGMPIGNYIAKLSYEGWELKAVVHFSTFQQIYHFQRRYDI